MVQIDDERAEPVMRRIEELEVKELEAFARRLLDEMERRQRKICRCIRDGCDSGVRYNMFSPPPC